MWKDTVCVSVPTRTDSWVVSALWFHEGCCELGVQNLSGTLRSVLVMRQPEVELWRHVVIG